MMMFTAGAMGQGYLGYNVSYPSDPLAHKKAPDNYTQNCNLVGHPKPF